MSTSQVLPFNPNDNSGTGWTFDHADGGAFRGAMGNALYTFRSEIDLLFIPRGTMRCKRHQESCVCCLHWPKEAICVACCLA